jgi:hypothetical protein
MKTALLALSAVVGLLIIAPLHWMFEFVRRSRQSELCDQTGRVRWMSENSPRRRKPGSPVRQYSS